MKYQKEVLLKDGTKCLLRGAGERDAAEILRCFHLTHAETDYLLTYPDIPWVPDPARYNGSQAMREELFDRYEEEVKATGVPYSVIRHDL